MLYLGRSTAWMLGRTPPDAMVTPPTSLFNSSSFFTARVVICLGTIRDFLLSRAAFSASSTEERSQHRGIQALLQGTLALLLSYELYTFLDEGASARYERHGTVVLPWQMKWWISFLHDLLFLFLCYSKLCQERERVEGKKWFKIGTDQQTKYVVC